MYFGNVLKFEFYKYSFSYNFICKFKIIFVSIGINLILFSCSPKSEYLNSAKNRILVSTLLSISHHTIELPKSTELSNPNENTLRILISKDNQYYIGDENSLPINKEELEAEILNNIGKDSTVELLGDKDSQLDHTIFVLDIVKKHGLKVIIKTKL